MNALTRGDRQRLTDLEGVIALGLGAWEAMGLALREIRDSRLYREEYESFEHYVGKRWEMGRSHAYRLIDAVRVVETLSPTGGAPANERQARELVPLEPEQRREVWEEATAGGEEPTAARLRELAAKALGSLSPDEQRVVIEANEREVMAHAEPKALPLPALAQMERLTNRLWKMTQGLGDNAEAPLRHLKAYLDCVRELLP